MNVDEVQSGLIFFFLVSQIFKPNKEYILSSLKFPVLQENLDVYMGLQQFIVTAGTSKSPSASVLRQLLVICADFADGD